MTLLSKNSERIDHTLLNLINPIKQNYKSFMQELEDKRASYIFQQESIETLHKENLLLRKRLLKQTHYIQQIQNIYQTLPQLRYAPIQNISLTETISYVKLNSFSKIILTKPKAVHQDRLYGLIQGDVVAGTAKMQNNQLYGYLTSDPACRFSVFIGKSHVPGIAMGVKANEMMVKFIPKWNKISEGDVVVTSGLDRIFFANIPVGVVKYVEMQSAYKIAHIQTYNDVFHPKTFFLINNADATLLENFDSNQTNIKLKAYSIPQLKERKEELSLPNESNQTQHLSPTPLISSIPQRIDQTQESVIEPIIPRERTTPPKKRVKVKKRRPKKRTTHKPNRPKPKPKAHSSSLDLF